MDDERFKDMPVWPGNAGPTLSDNIHVPDPKEEEPTAAEPKGDEDEGADDATDRKVRIPRSRLKTLTDRINQLEEQLKAGNASDERIAALEARLQNPQDELPPEWVALHGDSDVSKAAYKATQDLSKREFRAMLDEIERERVAQEKARAERAAAIEQSIDAQMDELEDSLGRKLTDTQKGELLDIVGKYSPRAADNPDLYTSYMSIENAYDIWNQTHKRDAGKDALARIAGTASSGEASGSSPQGNWDPNNWRSKYRHLGL